MSKEPIVGGAGFAASMQTAEEYARTLFAAEAAEVLVSTIARFTSGSLAEVTPSIVVAARAVHPTDTEAQLKHVKDELAVYAGADQARASAQRQLATMTQTASEGVDEYAGRWRRVALTAGVELGEGDGVKFAQGLRPAVFRNVVGQLAVLEEQQGSNLDFDVVQRLARRVEILCGGHDERRAAAPEAIERAVSAAVKDAENKHRREVAALKARAVLNGGAHQQQQQQHGDGGGRPSALRCYGCNGTGHKRIDCPEKRRDTASPKADTQQRHTQPQATQQNNVNTSNARGDVGELGEDELATIGDELARRMGMSSRTGFNLVINTERPSAGANKAADTDEPMNSAPVTISARGSETVTGRALLDCGSGRCWVTDDFALRAKAAIEEHAGSLEVGNFITGKRLIPHRTARVAVHLPSGGAREVNALVAESLGEYDFVVGAALLEAPRLKSDADSETPEDVDGDEAAQVADVDAGPQDEGEDEAVAPTTPAVPFDITDAPRGTYTDEQYSHNRQLFRALYREAELKNKKDKKRAAKRADADGDRDTRDDMRPGARAQVSSHEADALPAPPAAGVELGSGGLWVRLGFESEYRNQFVYVGTKFNNEVNDFYGLSGEFFHELRAGQTIPKDAAAPIDPVTVKLKDGAERHWLRGYPMTEAQRADLDKVIAERKETGCLQEVELSPGRRPDGDCVRAPGFLIGDRLLIDLSPFNDDIDMTDLDLAVVPNIDRLHKLLGRYNVFGTLDLTKAFDRIRVDMSQGTAVYTELAGKTYRVCRLPTGGILSAGILQSFMRHATRDIPDLGRSLNDEPREAGAEVYMDDFMGAGRIETPSDGGRASGEAYMRVMIAGQRAMNANNMATKPSKTAIWLDRVKSLGKVVGEHEIGLPPNAIEQVADLTFPQGVKALRGKVALLSYFSKHAPRVGFHLSRLNKITSGTGTVARAAKAKGLNVEDLKTDFELAKTELAAAPPLESPRPGWEWVLQTDASFDGLGAVVGQRDENGNFHIMGYTSRRTSRPESQMWPGALEARAVIFGLRRFDSVLAGQKVTVVTDHMALVPSKPDRTEIPALHQRWRRELLENRALRFEHKPGQFHVAPDALSRMVVEQPYAKHSETDTTERDRNIIGRFELGSDVGEQSDPDRGMGETGDEAPDVDPTAWVIGSRYVAERTGAGAHTRVIGTLFNALPRSTTIGERVWNPERRLGLCVPPAESKINPWRPGQPRYAPADRVDRLAVMTEIHAWFHTGETNLTRRVLDAGFGWSGMDKDAASVASSCNDCAWFKNTARGTGSAPTDTFIQTDIGAQIAVDCVKIPLAKDGSVGAVVIVEIATRYIYTESVHDFKADTISAVLRRYVLQFGPVRKVASDQGPENVGAATQLLGRQMANKWTFASAFTPTANSVAESAVRRILIPLRMLCKEGTTDWPQHLAVSTYAANTTRKSAGFPTPFELFFGRAPRTFFTIDDRCDAGEVEIAGEPEKDLADKVRRGRVLIQAVLEKAARDKVFAREMAKATAQDNTVEFKAGDFVKILDPAYATGKQSKLDPKFVGPLRVVERDQGGAYKLADLQGNVRPELYGARRLYRAPAPKQDRTERWFVDRVIDHRDTPKGREYLVRWEGYGKDSDSWEPRSSFATPEAVNNYERRMRKGRNGAGAAGAVSAGVDKLADGDMVRSTIVPGAGTIARRTRRQVRQIGERAA
jgi:hypothetical protein